MADDIIPAITRDTLLDGRLVLCQPAEGYRAAIDPVFLAAAAPVRDGQTVLDVGSGVGAASLCLALRVPGCRIFGIEMQAALTQLARDNAKANGMTARLDLLTGNIAAPPPRLPPGTFDHVITNPPFHAAERGRASPNAVKAAANTEGEADLAVWARFSINMLRPKGTLTMIYRADRLDAVLAALHGRLGEITIFPLWPKAGRSAKRVLLRGRKGIHAPTQLTPGMILHNDDGSYTAEAEAVLRLGVGLE